MTLFGGYFISMAILPCSCQEQNVDRSMGFRTHSSPIRHRKKAFGVKCCTPSLNRNTDTSWIGYEVVGSKERSSVRVLFFDISRNRINIIKDEKVYNRSITVFVFVFLRRKKSLLSFLWV